MSNNISSNIKRSNNPEDRWNSSEVNKELEKLDSNISKLSTDLMTTNTAQDVDGQKTFFSLFVDDEDSVITYDKVMEDIPFDISPIFGPGTYHFGKDRAVEEGRYNKHNASGALVDVASLNPCFMPSEISIEVISDTEVRIKALNVPLPLTTLGGSYSVSDTNMTAYLWKSSASINTIFEPTYISTSSIKSHELYLHYNLNTDTAYILDDTVDTGDNILVRCIGSVFSKNSKLIRSSQDKGVIKFNEEMLFADIRPLTGYFGPTSPFNKIFNTCILKLTVIPRITEKITYSDNTIYPILNHEASISTIQTPQQFPMYLPIHSDGKYLTTSSTDFNFWRVNEIIFGDLAL